MIISYPLAQQKPFFLNKRVPPLDLEKYFFQIALNHFLLKPVFSIWSQDSRMVWHLGIENIFPNLYSNVS